MFTYLDSTVRDRLIKQNKLVRIDAEGRAVDTQGDLEPVANAINVLGPIPLPLECGRNEYCVDWFVSVRHTQLNEVLHFADQWSESRGRESFADLASSMAVNSILVVGDPKRWQNPLIRIHSSCLTGDVFGSKRCECGPQLMTALDRIANDPAGGMLIYMSGHEGRGIGLWAKAATYLLQDAGESTYQANHSLGLPDDSRDFSDAATLIKYFYGDRPLRLLTNNPKKLNDLNSFGLNHVTRVKHVAGVNATNRPYLSAKRDWGHVLEDDDLALSRSSD
jgi:GTP cyclohydrolase II